MIDFYVKGGEYRAGFSRRGGTCFSLVHEQTGADILRAPPSEQALEESPFLYGNPILFPPNRIRGGTFTFEDREYRFPVNEKDTGCHLHGRLYCTEFTADEKLCKFTYTAENGEYLGFPHAFALTRQYALDENGLKDSITVFNRSSQNMPLMLAFHTTFRIPFLSGGTCRLSLNVKREQLRDKNYLPTGEYASGRARDNQISAGEFDPNEAISALYESASPMYLIDDASRTAVVMEGDDRYRYRMLWSCGKCFFVCEPQTCAIDCFHLKTSPKENGMLSIAPGKSITLSTRIYLKQNL